MHRKALLVRPPKDGRREILELNSWCGRVMFIASIVGAASMAREYCPTLGLLSRDGPPTPDLTKRLGTHA
jgi:hypothetical protein